MGADPQIWRSPPPVPQLPAGVVHVWRVALTPPPLALQALGRLLSPDERSRAAQYLEPGDRDRFVAARGALRRILGRYLAAPPATISLRYSPYGKPELAGPFLSSGLQFNLAHAHTLALVALARQRRVGVDLEPLAAGDDGLAAAHYCTPRERAALQRLAGPARRRAFLRCWTGKEALVKASGEGFFLAPDQLDLAEMLEKRQSIHEIRSTITGNNPWIVQAIEPDPTYIASLAVEGPPFQLECWHLDDAQW